MARESEPDMCQPDNVNVGTGASVFIAVFPVPGQVAISLQMRGTSGLLEIAGGGPSFFYGSTINIASFTPSLLANGSGWLISPGAILTINGPAAFWLSSGGSTAQVSLLRQIKRPQL